MRIGIIGGGAVGQALGRLFEEAGNDVTLGVRDGAAEGFVTAPIEDVAAAAELIVLAVPFTALATILPPLASILSGKIVVDATNPVAADWSPILLGETHSGGEEAQRLLPAARVAKAFNTVFADMMTLQRLDGPGGRATAFIASDDAEAARTVADLARAAGFAPELAGPLSSSRWLEAMAHLNIRLAATLGGGTGAAFVYRRVA